MEAMNKHSPGAAVHTTSAAAACRWLDPQANLPLTQADGDVALLAINKVIRIAMTACVAHDPAVLRLWEQRDMNRHRCRRQVNHGAGACLGIAREAQDLSNRRPVGVCRAR